MREIKLSKNKITLVDDEDYEFLMQWNWFAYEDWHTWYAIKNGENHKQTKMHRLIMNASVGWLVDHKDGNGLNNQRQNLRICTHAQNSRNRTKKLNNTSGYKGVYWNSQKKKFRARIAFDGKTISIGYFLSAEDAAHAWDEYAKIYHGEYARLNFPER